MTILDHIKSNKVETFLGVLFTFAFCISVYAMFALAYGVFYG